MEQNTVPVWLVQLVGTQLLRIHLLEAEVQRLTKAVADEDNEE